jgi:hypothetical protein
MNTILYIKNTRYVSVRCHGTQIDESPIAQDPGDRKREYNDDDKICGYIV